LARIWTTNCYWRRSSVLVKLLLIAQRSWFPYSLIGKIVLHHTLLCWPPLVLGGSNFLADFSAISACSTSSFHVWALTTPIRIFTLSRKLCRHISSNMCNDMPTGHIRERLWNLSMYSHTDSPPFWTIERSLPMSPRYHPHRIERGTEFLGTQELMEPLGRLLNQSKATPLKVSLNSLAMMASSLAQRPFP